MKLSNGTRKWIRAGIETLIHGGTSALIVAFVGWNMSMTWPEWWHLVEASFIANGAVRFLQWWNNNPLPPEGDTQQFGEHGKIIDVRQAQISLNPFNKVQSITK